MDRFGVPVDVATVNAAPDGAELLPGAAEAVAGLHAAGVATAIISGGIDYLAQKLAAEWDMAEAHANPLVDSPAGLQGDIHVSGHAKAPVMRGVMARHHAVREEVAAVVPQTWSETTWGTPSLDLGAGERAQLEALDVSLTEVARCTIEDPALHSHRRDGATAGRMAGLVWTS